VPKFRTDRVSGEVQKEIDRIIREEVKDPRLGGTFAVTRAEVTRDLRHAKVYISVLEDDLFKDTMDALRNAAGFIRRELGRRMNLRYTPELHFQEDHNIEYGIHMAKLLKDLGLGQEPEEEQP
jgi:ribosome-binding factor A